MLKGLWGEEGSGGIRKKLKYEAQLICNVKIRNDWELNLDLPRMVSLRCPPLHTVTSSLVE